MTVKELYEKLNDLINQGKGDLVVTLTHSAEKATVTSVVTGVYETKAYTNMEYTDWYDKKLRKIDFGSLMVDLEIEDIDWSWSY